MPLPRTNSASQVHFGYGQPEIFPQIRRDRVKLRESSAARSAADESRRIRVRVGRFQR